MSTIHGSIFSRRSRAISVSVIRGHFATENSHVNYYINLNEAKDRLRMSKAVASELAARYDMISVDTILCLDGTKLIGAYIADEISKRRNVINSGLDISIIQPERSKGGYLIFRENNQDMIENKNVLMLVSSISTGQTVYNALECVQYYGGYPAGVCALFSVVPEIHGQEVNAIFTNEDITDYRSYSPESCEMCAAGQKIDAVVNAFGFSRL